MSKDDSTYELTLKEKVIKVARAAAPIAGSVVLTIATTVAAQAAAKAVTDRMTPPAK